MEIQTDYISFFKGMLTWYEDFNKCLLEDNLAYQGMTYKIAANKINHIDIKWDKVWFVGLNALTKAEQSVMILKKKKILPGFFGMLIFFIMIIHCM